MGEATTHPVPHPDLPDYLAATLSAQEREAFEVHLAECEVCRADVDELTPVVRLVQQAPAVAEVDVPPGLRAQTLAAVTGQAPKSSAPLSLARQRRGVTISLRGAALAAAVVVVLGLVASGVFLQVGERPAAAEITLVDPAGGPARGSASIRTTTDGRSVDLTVEGMKPSQPGTYYECWFVGDGDTIDQPNRVSVGTFTVGASGRADVQMTSAADAGRYPRMGVTLEPDDGNPQRTGDKALVSK